MLGTNARQGDTSEQNAQHARASAVSQREATEPRLPPEPEARSPHSLSSKHRKDEAARSTSFKGLGGAPHSAAARGNHL